MIDDLDYSVRGRGNAAAWSDLASVRRLHYETTACVARSSGQAISYERLGQTRPLTQSLARVTRIELIDECSAPPCAVTTGGVCQLQCDGAAADLALRCGER